MNHKWIAYHIAAYRSRQVACRTYEDVQLIGFDNIRFSQIMTPALTTIEQPITEIGRQAVLSLIDCIENKPTKQHYTFDVKLISRQTTQLL